MTKRLGALPVAAEFLRRLDPRGDRRRAAATGIRGADLTHGQVIEVPVANRLTAPAPLLRVGDWAYPCEAVKGLGGGRCVSRLVHQRVSSVSCWRLRRSVALSRPAGGSKMSPQGHHRNSKMSMARRRRIKSSSGSTSEEHPPRLPTARTPGTTVGHSQSAKSTTTQMACACVHASPSTLRNDQGLLRQALASRFHEACCPRVDQKHGKCP